MNCDEARELLAGYVLEALEPDERAAVARHLKHCSDCAALASALAGAAHELPLVLTALDAPVLPATVLERLEQVTVPPPRRHWLPRPRVLTRLAAAAVVVLTVIAVLAAVRSQQAVADEHQLRARLVALVGQQSTIFDVVDSPHTTKLLLHAERAGSRAYGKVYIRTDTNEAVAFVNRLRAPPDGRRYQLWTRSGPATALAGVFTLHNGFGYLLFRHNGRQRISDAFVTLQLPSTSPSRTVVLKLAKRS
jgi:hypothetical protein